VSKQRANEASQRAPEDASRGLAKLDHGRYAEEVQRFFGHGKPGPDQDHVTRLWHAEIALYLGQSDDARAAVQEVEADLERQRGDSGDIGSLARRAAVVSAETAAAAGDLTSAESTATAVLEGAVKAGDGQFAMRARYDLGVFAGAKGEYPLALERLAVASRTASELGNEFFQGLIAHRRALFLWKLGELSASEGRFIEAVDLLGRTENLLNRASAQTNYGRLLAELGRFEEAIDLFRRAESQDLPAAAGVDPRPVRAAMAKCLLGLGRYDDAAARLEGLLELERAMRSRAGELDALRMLARAELGRNRPEAAERAASEAAQVAALVGSPADLVDARLLSARAKARIGRPKAAEEINALMLEIEDSGDDLHRAEARICLAEALVVENPVESERLLAEVKTMAGFESSPRLTAEFDRVNRARLRAPVRVNEDGTLVVDTRGEWPKLKHAREALERFLLERSLTETHGNAAAAGRLIGETRYQMHYLRRIFERGEGRPSRARVFGEEEGTERARRSASRPKRLVRRRGR
jgi:tetratricopeptide (TPR) repeat protein